MGNKEAYISQKLFGSRHKITHIFQKHFGFLHNLESSGFECEFYLDARKKVQIGCAEFDENANENNENIEMMLTKKHRSIQSLVVGSPIHTINNFIFVGDESGSDSM